MTDNSDPRVGLGGGWWDAEETAWNMRLVSETRPADPFIPATAGDFSYMSSDMAFTTDYLIQGNFHGIQIWDISNPAVPSPVAAHECPGWQNDVSVFGDLLFASVEDLNSRVDCGAEPMPEQVHPDRMRGIRIFDISDIANPRLVTNVQTCRGSHTHTRDRPRRHRERIHLRVGLGAGAARGRARGLRGRAARPGPELGAPTDRRHPGARRRSRGCADRELGANLRGSRGAPDPPGAGPGDRGPAYGSITRPVPRHHGLPGARAGGGACQGHGFLLDIQDVKNPKRSVSVVDKNFSYWHSATFNNDGTKLLFTDEWGGGLQPKCRASDPREWGANAIFTRDGENLGFEGYYKL